MAGPSITVTREGSGGSGPGGPIPSNVAPGRPPNLCKLLTHRATRCTPKTSAQEASSRLTLRLDEVAVADRGAALDLAPGEAGVLDGN
jgi:hypothetical protein